jgi:hypothetical protein
MPSNPWRGSVDPVLAVTDPFTHADADLNGINGWVDPSLGFGSAEMRIRSNALGTIETVLDGLNGAAHNTTFGSGSSVAQCITVATWDSASNYGEVMQMSVSAVGDTTSGYLLTLGESLVGLGAVIYRVVAGTLTQVATQSGLGTPNAGDKFVSWVNDRGDDGIDLHLGWDTGAGSSQIVAFVDTDAARVRGPYYPGTGIGALGFTLDDYSVQFYTNSLPEVIASNNTFVTNTFAVTLDWFGGVNAGDVTLISFLWNNALGANPTVSDDTGQTWTKIGTTCVGTTYNTAVWWARYASAQATTNITATFGAGSSDMYAEAVLIRYTDPIPIGASITSASPGTTASGTDGTSMGAITPTTNECALYDFFSCTTQLSNTVAAGTNWRECDDNNNNPRSSISERYISSPTSITPTWTIGTASREFAGVVVEIKGIQTPSSTNIGEFYNPCRAIGKGFFKFLAGGLGPSALGTFISDGTVPEVLASDTQPFIGGGYYEQ